MLRRRPRSTLFPYTTLFRSVRMQRGKHQVSSKSGFNGDFSGFKVADLAHQNHVGILPQKGAQRGGKVQANGFLDRKSTRLNSSHANISYAVFCLKKKKNNISAGISLIQAQRSNVYMGYWIIDTEPMKTAALHAKASFWLSQDWNSNVAHSYYFGN